VCVCVFGGGGEGGQLRAPHLHDALELQVSVKVSSESHSGSLVSSIVSKAFLYTMQLTRHPASTGSRVIISKDNPFRQTLAFSAGLHVLVWMKGAQLNWEKVLPPPHPPSTPTPDALLTCCSLAAPAAAGFVCQVLAPV